MIRILLVLAILILVAGFSIPASAQVYYYAPATTTILQPATVFTAPVLMPIAPGYTYAAPRGWNAATVANDGYMSVQPMAAVGTTFVPRRFGWRWLGPKPVTVAIPLQ
jgi:hypothetical protein